MKEKNVKKNKVLEESTHSIKNDEDSLLNKSEKSYNSLKSINFPSSLIITTKKHDEKYGQKEKEIKIGNYLIKKSLGKGTFGKVKLGIYLPRNKKVAIKIIEKDRIKEEDDIVRLKREFEMLSQFNHPNVITVSEIFESNDEYFTVMEYCEGGELFNYIVANKYLTEEKSAFFYYQLINGLEYIHSLGIVHRDLKPENLLLTKDHILKIIDFGLSNYFKKDQIELLETPCGSPCYASPEMLSGVNYDGFKIDIWATGIILFAMLCGFLPFDDKDNNVLFEKILDCKVKFPNILSKNAKDLLEKILVIDPNKRINISEIKKHPFYLKGKEIFEKNFTIYQVSAEDVIDSEDSGCYYDFKYMNENSFINNLIYYESFQKSAENINKLNKIDIFKIENLKERSISINIVNKKKEKNLIYDDKIKHRKLKKLIDLEKKIRKMKKNNKNKNKDKTINRKRKKENKKNDNETTKKFLNYNHSITFQIKDINHFIENLIIQNKIEEDLLKNEKKNLEKNKIIIKPKKKNKSEDNTKNKFDNKNEKNKNKKIKESNEKIKSLDYFNLLNKRHINQNKKLNSHNYNNKNIKAKKIDTTKINKLFINNFNIIKINKLQQNSKSKRPKRKIRSTSNNNSNRKNFKNILKMIKEHSLKVNINFINKKNIVHHHTTNITNLTQKNYFSNVIINNYKAKDEHKLNYTCKNRCKILFESPNFKLDKNINTNIREYLQKNGISNIKQMKKYTLKNWKIKTNLQKIKTSLQKVIFKDDLLNSIKLNSKKKEEGKTQNNSMIKNKKIKIQTEPESKTIPTTIINNKKRKHYKIRVSYINNNLTKNKFYKNNYLNSDNSSKNHSMRGKDNIIRYPQCNPKGHKFLLSEVNLDEESNKSKMNYVISTENSQSYRGHNKNLLNFKDKNKICNFSVKNWNKPQIKKIENLKKNSINSKIMMNFKKFKKLDIKDILASNIAKTESNSIINNPKIVNSQRNKSSGKKNIKTYNYMNSARSNEKKLINISFNIVNNHHYFGNLTENKSSYNNKHFCSLIKFKTNKNKIRNKNVNCINKNLILNITNDNIKTDKNSKNQSSLNNDFKISYKNIAEKRRANTNIYFEKFLESRKLLSSLKKRINFKSILLNNISTKANQNKIHFKKISKKNENISNNSDFVNYSTNIKQFKINNNIENKKINFIKKVIKNNDNLKLKKDLHSSLPGDKLKHKKIKSMKASIFDNKKIKINEKKINKPLKILNVENNNLSNNSIGLYFNNNSDLNSNYSNNNTNINSIESNIFKSPVGKSKNLFS